MSSSGATAPWGTRHLTLRKRRILNSFARSQVADLKTKSVQLWKEFSTKVLITNIAHFKNDTAEIQWIIGLNYFRSVFWLVPFEIKILWTLQRLLPPRSGDGLLRDSHVVKKRSEAQGNTPWLAWHTWLQLNISDYVLFDAVSPQNL